MGWVRRGLGRALVFGLAGVAMIVGVTAAVSAAGAQPPGGVEPVIVALSAANGHTCAVDQDGTVLCWGDYDYAHNQETTGPLPWFTPTVVDIGGPAEAIGGGGNRTCATTGGGVRCWIGAADGGVTVSTIPDLDAVVDLAVGRSHACAVHGEGAVSCWGRPSGIDGGSDRIWQDQPVAATGFEDAVQVAVGEQATCVLRTDGTVACWGSNGSGLLGFDELTRIPMSAPRTITGLPPVVDLSLGSAHGCAVTDSGTTYCWGWGADGRLGIEAAAARIPPTLVPGVPTATSVRVGGDQAEDNRSSLRPLTCVTEAAGGVSCWGSNDRGQLGDGTTSPRIGPGPVPLTGTSAVAPGGRHACALDDEGVVRCWGYGGGGQQAGGASTDHRTPQPVTGYGRPLEVIALGPEDRVAFTDIDAGPAHTCGLAVGGDVYCWGNNGQGQLGIGSYESSSVPVKVPGVREAVSLAVGIEGVCVLEDDGDLRCWGDRRRPAPAMIASTVPGALAYSFRHPCSTGIQGVVQCWDVFAVGPPVTIAGLPPIVQLGAGIEPVIANNLLRWCGRSETSDVYCWQSNATFSQAARLANVTPSLVPEAGPAASVALNDGHFCAASENPPGTVRCWGDNEHGELGDGTMNPRTDPTPVSGLMGAVDIDAGWDHTCAALADRSVRCWGRNAFGEVGDGSTDPSPTPRTVGGVDSAWKVAAGELHSCALATSGGVLCWGRDQLGALGNGSDVDAAPIDGVPATRVVGTEPTAVAPTVLDARVISELGPPVAEIKIDLFRAEGFRRGQFLGATRTDQDGHARWVGLAAGCYYLTFIAPDGQTFVSGSRWYQPRVCLTEEEVIDDVLGVLAGTGSIGRIDGVVTDQVGPLAGVLVERHEGDEDGPVLDSTTTDEDGRFTLAVQPGCHTIVIHEPRPSRIAGVWSTFVAERCVEAGELADTIEAFYPGGVGTTGVVVEDETGPVADVKVDLFEWRGPGTVRGRFLGFDRTNIGGSVRHLLREGCYVYTVIAPEGRTFIGGDRFFQRKHCVRESESTPSIRPMLTGESNIAWLSGRVEDANAFRAPVEDLKIDLFRANGDGSRGEVLGFTRTAADGRFTLAVEPDCYVLTFIAPEGRLFLNGRRWHQPSMCVVQGERRDTVNATLKALP